MDYHPFSRGDAVVGDVERDAHRLLARVFLEHLGAQPGDASDDEDQLADHRGEAEVDEDRGERAVDVQRDRFDLLGHRRFQRARETDAVASQTRVLREAEQHGDARIHGRVHAMSEAGQACLRRLRFVHQLRGDLLEGAAVAPRAFEAGGDQLHAAGARAAMLVADRQHARRNGGRGGLAVAGRREPRRRARRRAGAVIGDADQDGVHEPPLGRRRQPIVMQQEDHLGERRLPHQVEDVVSTHADVIRAGVNDRGVPGFHSSGWIIAPSIGNEPVLR